MRLQRLILNGWVYFGLIDLLQIAAIDFFRGFLLKVRVYANKIETKILRTLFENF